MKKIISFIIIMMSFFMITEVKAEGFAVEGFKLKEKSESMEVLDVSFENNIIDSKITFNKKDDYVIFEFNIINNEEENYVIDSISDNNTNKHIEIKYDYLKKDIKPKGESKIIVTMKYSDKLLNIEKETIDGLKLTINLKESVDTPKTSDNIIKYVIMYLVSFIVFVTLIFFVAKKYRKLSIFVIALILLVPYAVYALKEITIELTFNNIEIKGEFETYNINFDENNGKSFTLDIEYGKTIGYIEKPEKEGYTFVKWVDEEGNEVDEDTVINKPMNVIAQYSLINYSISYDLNGGTLEDKTEYTIEDEVKINNPTKEHYTFIGWTGSNGETPVKDLVIPIGSYGDKTYTANYEPFKYSIIYDLDGGVATNVTEYTIEDEVKLNHPTKEYYKFIGWTGSNGETIELDLVIPVGSYGNKNYTANYDHLMGTIIFNSNDGNNDTYNQTPFLGVETNLNANTFTRDGYRFLGWNSESDGSGTHYDNGGAITLTSETDFNLYAEWIELRANLIIGDTINDYIKALNPSMTEFKKSPTKPDLDNIEYKIISTDDSIFPVYIWNDNGIIYWWSEAEKVLMNSDSSYMFYGLTNLTNVDFTGLDSSEVTIMDFMFQRCTSLTTFDLKLDTSNVISMDAMFANCTNLVSIDFSHVNTSKVQNFHGLVAGCTKLENINLENFNTTGALSFESMFSTLPNLIEIDLSSFNTPILESIYFMFLRCTNLVTVYASENFDVTSVTDSRGPFSQATKIVGGAGTVYSSANVNLKDYIRIDDPDNGKPGYLTLKNARYIRYDGNGSDGGDAMTSHYLTTTTPGNLKTNTYTKVGSTFVGWNTSPDGSGESYTDGQLMDTLTSSKTPLTLYAQWQ